MPEYTTDDIQQRDIRMPDLAADKSVAYWAAGIAIGAIVLLALFHGAFNQLMK